MPETWKAKTFVTINIQLYPIRSMLTYYLLFPLFLLIFVQIMITFWYLEIEKHYELKGSIFTYLPIRLLYTERQDYISALNYLHGFYVGTSRCLEHIIEAQIPYH